MSRRRPGRAHDRLLRTRRTPLGAVGVALVALLTAGPAVAAPVQGGPAAGILAAPGPKKAARCDGSAGWSAVAGRPSSLAPLGAAGLYVWNERGVWRIATTHGDRRPQLFQGTVSFDAPVTRANGVEGKSTIAPSGAAGVSFTFKNYGQVDGIAVVAPCATTVTVSGQVDGQPLTTSAVLLGPNGINPAAMPAVMTRGNPSETAAVTASAASATAAAAAVTTAAPTTTAACAASSPWPAATAGRPAINRLRATGSPASVFAWSDRNTWRILVTADPGTATVVEGRITATAPLSGRFLVDGGRDGAPRDGGRDGGRDGSGRDSIRVDGNGLTFRLRGSAQGAVLEVGTGCAGSLVLESLTVDGAPVAAGALVIGAASAAPASLPYAVTR